MDGRDACGRPIDTLSSCIESGRCPGAGRCDISNVGDPKGLKASRDALPTVTQCVGTYTIHASVAPTVQRSYTQLPVS